MKTLFITTCSLFSLYSFSQDHAGIYTNTDKLPREEDSLILNSNNTFRFAFHFPADNVSEWYGGKWTVKDDKVYLWITGDKDPGFVLQSSGDEKQLTITNARKLRDLKKDILKKQQVK